MIDISINSDEWIKIVEKVAEEVAQLPEIVSIIAVNTIQDRFNNQEYNGIQWEQDLMNSHVGVKTGDLRRDLTVNIEPDEVTITFEHDYASYFNQDVEQYVTAKQKRFFWAMYYKTKNEIWKGLALKPVGSLLYKKERPLIGNDDAELWNNIEKFIKENFKNNII